MPFPSVVGTAGLKFTMSSTKDTQLTGFQFQIETKGGAQHGSAAAAHGWCVHLVDRS